MGHILDLPDELLRKIAQFLISEARQDFENDKALVCRQPALICKKFSATYIAVLWNHPYLCERTIPKFTSALKGISDRSPEFVKNVKHLTISWKERRVEESRVGVKGKGKGKGREKDGVDGHESEAKGKGKDRKGKGRQMDIDMDVDESLNEDAEAMSSSLDVDTAPTGSGSTFAIDGPTAGRRAFLAPGRGSHHLNTPHIWYHHLYGQGYLRDNEQGPLTLLDTERRESWNRYQPFYLMCQHLADVFDRAKAASIAGKPDDDNDGDDDTDIGARNQPGLSRRGPFVPTKRTRSDAELYFRQVNADLDGPFSSPEAATRIINKKKGPKYELKWDDPDEINPLQGCGQAQAPGPGGSAQGTQQGEDEEELTNAYNAVYFGGEPEQGQDGQRETTAQVHVQAEAEAGPGVVMEPMTPFTLDVSTAESFLIQEDQSAEEEMQFLADGPDEEEGDEEGESEEAEDAVDEEGQQYQEDDEEEDPNYETDSDIAEEGHEGESEADLQAGVDAAEDLGPMDPMPGAGQDVVPTPAQPGRTASESSTRSTTRHHSISSVHSQCASTSSEAVAGPSAGSTGVAPGLATPEGSASGTVMRSGRISGPPVEHNISTRIEADWPVRTSIAPLSGKVLNGTSKDKNGKVDLFVPIHHVIPLRRVPLITLTVEGLDLTTHKAVRDLTYGLCHLRPKKVRFGYSVSRVALDQCQVGERFRLQHAMRVNVARFTRVWSEDDRLAALYFQPVNSLSARVFVDAKLWILRQLSCRHVRLAVPKNMKSLEFLAGRRLAWRHYHRHGRAQLLGGELLHHPALMNQLMPPAPPVLAADAEVQGDVLEDTGEGEGAADGGNAPSDGDLDADASVTMDLADLPAAPGSADTADTITVGSGWRQISDTGTVETARDTIMPGAYPQAFPLLTGTTNAASMSNTPTASTGTLGVLSNETTVAGDTAPGMLVLQPIIPQWHPPEEVPTVHPEGWDQNLFDLAMADAQNIDRSRSRSLSIGSYLSFSTKDEENTNTQYGDPHDDRLRGTRRRGELPEAERVRIVALQIANQQRDVILNAATTLFELEVFPRDFDDERWFEYGLDLPMELCRIRYGTSSWETIPIDAGAPDTFSIEEESAHSFARSPYVPPSPDFDFSGGESGDDFAMLTDSGEDNDDEEDGDEDMMDST